MYLYISGTWLIANLIHPFMMFILLGSDAAFSMESIGFSLQFIVYSIIFSIPSLLFSILAMYGITKLPLPDTGKFISWLITAPVVVFINYWLLFRGFFNDELDRDSIDFMLPGMLSAVLIILIRYPVFFKAVRKESEGKEAVRGETGEEIK